MPQIIELAVNVVWTLLGSMASAISEMLSADFWNEALNDIVYSFTDIDWPGIGMQCLEGIAQGFEKNFVKVKDSITNIAQGIKGIFTGELEIHSPSKIFEDYGQMIDEGLAIGISSGVSIDATEEMADDVSTSFSPSLAGAGGDVVIPVYIGNELIQTIVVDALNIANYRSGGR